MSFNPYSGSVVPLFDHYTSVGNLYTNETDLYSDTIVGGTLATDGDKLEFMYSGTSGGVSAVVFKVYFGGSVIYTSDSEGGGSPWVITGTLIRVSSTVIRYSVALTGANVPTLGPTEVGELTSLTLLSSNILKVSVECTTPATPNNDIVAILGSVTWISHA